MGGNMEIDMKPYAVIDTNTNKVLFVHDWNGIPYDAETNPTGWTPPENTTSIDLSNFTDKQMIDIEAGGTYMSGKFTRPDYQGPQPLTEEQIIQNATAQEVLQVLVDKGVITPQDLIS